MTLAIVGSRGYDNYKEFYLELNVILKEHKINTFVSGGAKGADTMAEQYAKEHGIKILVLKPNWKKYGKKAGFLRNNEIIQKCDVVVAFWDGSSHGTKHSIQLAKKLSKPIKIIRY